MSLLAAFAFSVDIGLLVLAWLVQLIMYPALAAIAPTKFRDWHRTHSRRIAWVVLPLMSSQLALHAWSVWSGSGVVAQIALALIVATWLVTFAGAVPCHRRLAAEGFAAATHRRLMRWHLVRTMLWSVVPVLTWWHATN